MGKEIDFEDEFDFGFTAVSEDEIKLTSNEKVEQMYKMILPLLNNLAKDADKNEYIHWPNRKEKIEQFIERLTKMKDS